MSLPRYHRADNPRPMRLTRRDKEVIKAVYTHRVLRRGQIQALFWPGKSNRAVNRRLSLLYHHGFLDRRFPPVVYGEGDVQAVYLLDERGADLLAAEIGVDRGELAWSVKDNAVATPFLEHLLATNDFRVAVELGVKGRGWKLTRWVPERVLRSVGQHDRVSISGRRGAYRSVAVIPDGYFVLEFDEHVAHFFLELDRGTMSNTRFMDRVRAYLAYTKGTRTGQSLYYRRYQTKSLRVLTVTTGGKRRRDNLKRSTEQAGGRAMFWFTTLAECIPDSVLSAAIWQRAGDEDQHKLIY